MSNYALAQLRNDAQILNINQTNINKICIKLLLSFHKGIIKLFNNKYDDSNNNIFNIRAYSYFSQAMIKTKRVYDRIPLNKNLNENIENFIDELSEINDMWSKILIDINDVCIKHSDESQYKMVKKVEIAKIRKPLEFNIEKLIDNIETAQYNELFINTKISKIVTLIFSILRKIFLSMRIMSYDERMIDFSEDIKDLSNYNPFKLRY